MTEAIISNLAQINSLRVISRTSVMKYKNDGKSLKEIANELDVDAILEGSVVQDSNKARISVHLIDAKSEKHIWTKKYDRQLKDILTIQNKLSLDVTREVKIALTEEEETRLSKIQQINPNAHDAYLKGQYQIDQYTMGIGDVNNLKQGISYLQQSIEIDPKWAKAYAGLAYAYHWLASSRKKYEYFPMSKAAALKAIELDETNAKAHGSLAYVLHNYDWDWDGAAKEYKRANELNPNGFAWGTALFYRSAGFYKDAIRWYQRAIDRNPLSAPLQRQLGETYLYDGQVDQALEEINKSLELNPNNASARTTLADIYLKKNNFRSALEEAGKAYTISNDPLFLARLGFTDVRCNLLDDAQKILNRLKAENLDENLLPLAELYVGLGYKKKALSLVEQAFDNKSMELLYIKETVLVDSLGQNPSFQNILKKINFPITKYKI